jgi:hypothetical protein
MRLEEKRGKMLKFLGWMANFKPHVYFLLWKKVTVYEYVNNLKQEIVVNKKKARVATGAGQLKVSLDSSRLPILRLAFAKLIGPNKEEIIRRAMADLGNNHDKALRNKLFLWKIAVFRKTMDEGMAALAKRPKVIDGVMKLEKVKNRRPRLALRNLNKNRELKDKIEDSIRKLLFINKIGMQRGFMIWSGKEDFPAKLEKTQKLLMLLGVHRGFLRLAFNKILSHDADEHKRALRALMICLMRKPR